MLGGVRDEVVYATKWCHARKCKSCGLSSVIVDVTLRTRRKTSGRDLQGPDLNLRLQPDPDPDRTIIRCHRKLSMEGTPTSSFRTARIVSCAFLRVWLPFLAHYAQACVDDTCAQPGYWSAVAEFVAGLHPKVVPSSPSS
jgi:hypothetical protein